MEPFKQLVDVIDPTTIEEVSIEDKPAIRIRSTDLYWLPGFHISDQAQESKIVVYNSIHANFKDGNYTVPSGESAIKHLLILAFLLANEEYSNRLVEYCKLPTSKLWKWVHETALDNEARVAISPEGKPSILGLLTVSLSAFMGDCMIDRKYLANKVTPAYIIQKIIESWTGSHKVLMACALEIFIQSMEIETELSSEVLVMINKYKDISPLPTNRMQEYIKGVELLGDTFRQAYPVSKD